jgi:hypothetical protein
MVPPTKHYGPSADVCGCLRVSAVVCSADAPSFIGLAGWEQDVKKDEFFCTHPAKVIRPDPLEKPWKWGVLESVPLSSPAG